MRQHRNPDDTCTCMLVQVSNPYMTRWDCFGKITLAMTDVR